MKLTYSNFPFFLGFLAILWVAGCQPSNENTAVENDLSQNTSRRRSVPVPKFERDTAYAFVKKQLSFGPRAPETEAHRQCGDWLAAQLRTYGAAVIEQTFQAEAYTGEKLNGRNIIGQFNPQANKRILLAAHWDTRPMADSPQADKSRENEPIPGADDGASGVAVLLEIARQLQQNPIDMGVDIIFFDLEDYGERGGKAETWALGSQYWARNLHRGGYNPDYGILLDMVGAKNARFAKEQISMQYAPQLVNKIWELAGNMGYGNYFIQARGGTVTDDHYFVNTIANIPMIDIINHSTATETGFGEYWHTHGDDIDIISKRTLRAVGQVVLAAVYRENNGSL